MRENDLCSALADRCRGARSQALVGFSRMAFPPECVNAREMGVSSRFKSKSSFPARVASAASQLLQLQTAAASSQLRKSGKGRNYI